MNNFVAMCIFLLLGIQLHNEILAGCQNVNSHVVLLHIAKFPSIRVAPVFIPTGHKNACFLTVSSSVDLSDSHLYTSFLPEVARVFLWFMLPLLSQVQEGLKGL